MIRHRDKAIMRAAYFDDVWRREFSTRPWKYDGTRHRALLSKFQAGQSLVDLGAGVYGTAQYAIEVMRFSDSRFVAYDRSIEAKRIVNEQCPEIEYVTGTLPDTPFLDGEFDYVVATQILESVEEPTKLAQEMARICKSGGYISAMAIDMKCENARKHGTWSVMVWSFDSVDLYNLFGGFGEIYQEQVGDYHFLLCRKS